MSRQVIVVDHPRDWSAYLPADLLMSASDYIARVGLADGETVKVTNLCRSYRYLEIGYYVSLLAEARGHRAIPSVRTTLELSRKAIYELETDDLDAELQKQLKKRQETVIRFAIYFGRASDPDQQDLADELFERFPCPMLEVELRRNGKWNLHHVRPGNLSTLKGAEQERLAQALLTFLGQRWRNPRPRTVSRYDLAILHKTDDRLAPSNARALRNFIKAGKKLGVDVELIERKDYSRLPEYDALFIRETTSIDHHTFRFAKKAEAEGMVVIDDPTSILRCTNKVYLAELLRTNRIKAPRTLVLQQDRKPGDEDGFEYPIVLKIPDGAFSLGVYKAQNPAEFKEISTRLFRESDLILAQEYLYTDFDWRIGILNRKPLYACQYFMSKSHWQIFKHKDGGGYSEGDAHTLPIEEVPKAVLQTALKAANLIGDGLYGVDLKQNERGVFVIEVNDNPNLDAGIEDLVLKDKLYQDIIAEFVRRLELQRQS